MTGVRIPGGPGASTVSVLAPAPLQRHRSAMSREARVRSLVGRYAVPLVGAVILLAAVLAAIFVPLVSAFDPFNQSLFTRLKPPGTVSQTGETFLLGTDELGRDIMVRMFLGARLSLLISLVSVIGAGILGTAIGLIAGYFGGWLDDVLMRLTDTQLAFPVTLLALAIVALLGPGVVNVIVVFIITGWPIFARTGRASTLSIREMVYVDAARCLGNSDWRILWKHVAPSAASPLSVVAAFELAKVVIYEASLGFLGLGVQPPTPTLGNMMGVGRNYMDQAWWLTFFPGLILVLTAAAANWVGDGLNEYFDPRGKRQ
jgi:peptide/nickel transport system permease protein